MEIASGFSSLIKIQLNTAPSTGIRNFQILRFETFTPGLCSKVNQMAKAAADRKLNQPSVTKYTGGNGPVFIPSAEWKSGIN